MGLEGQPPVVATLHQPAKDPGPHPSRPTQACSRGSRNSQRRLPKGPPVPPQLALTLPSLCRERLGPRVHFIPAFPLLTWLLSVHVFLMSFCQMCKSVWFVYFETHFCYPDSVKVHVHSCLTPSLLGVRTPEGLLPRLLFLTGKGLYSHMLGFFQGKKKNCENR